MRAARRKTLWQNSLFSAVISAGILAIVLIRRDWTTAVLALLLFIYVAGNAVLHVRHDDFKKETLLEYSLLSFAVFVVLASAVL